MQEIQNIYEYPGVAPFRFFIQYGEGDGVYKHPDQHFHPECELYVHLEGNVSFMVEDTVYPVGDGEVILSRPYEYHHCIYHDTSLHRHYWILISCEGNGALFAPFFDRPSGVGNRIVLTPENSRRLVATCRTLEEAQNMDTLGRYHLFFRLLSLLADGVSAAPRDDEAVLPPDVKTAMEYIDNRLQTGLSIKQLAEAAHTSINTLERHFRTALDITPREYMNVRRLTRARELLSQGLSVQETCDRCGFPDYSHFIALFRRRFGITPLQYKLSVQ